MTPSRTWNDRRFYREVYEEGEGPWSNLSELDRRTADWIEILDQERSGPARVLDLGTGRGRMADLFCRSGYPAVGIDYLREPLRDARQQFGRDGVGFVQADAFDPPFRSGTFFGLVDYGLLHHVRRTGREGYRDITLGLLRPGGFFFVNVFHESDEHADRGKKDWVYHRGHYDHFFTRETLDEFLGDGYERRDSGLIEDGEHRFLHALYRKRDGGD